MTTTATMKAPSSTDTRLTRAQRGAVFDEILRELEPVCPELFDVRHDLDRGGLVELYGHLDELVAIVRRTAAAAAAGRVESYAVQVREHICSACPNQQPGGFCALRYANACVLSAHATRIARAIGRALCASRDRSVPERDVACSPRS